MPVDPQSDPPVPEGRWASFRYRDFSILQAARLINMISFQMMAVALAYDVYEQTRNPLTLGYMGLAQFLPALIFALVSGHAADRYRRQTVIQICLAALVICMVLVTVVAQRGFHDMFSIYCILFLIGTARTFLHPATQALLPQLVPRRLFSNAVTWSSSIFNLSAIAGPGIGGALCALHKSTLPVYIDSCVMMSIATVLMFFVKAPMHKRDETGSMWERLSAGIWFVFRRRVILGVISLDLFAVLLGGATALLPIYAKDILHVGPQGLGFLRAAFSVGSICMGFALTHLPSLRNAGNTMLWNVAGFGLFTIIFGISTNFWLSLACLFMLGVFDMVSVVIRHTMVQLLTPDAMRGRVSAVNAIFINTSNELGEFESGFTAAWWGTVRAVVIGGLGTLVVTGLWAWWFPEVRKFKRLDQSHEDLLRDQEIEEMESKVAV